MKREQRKYSKKVERLENEEEWEIKENEVKINWTKIFILGFITAIVFLIIDAIIVLILYLGFEKEILLVLQFMQYILFGETGLVIFIGACLGNFGQSAMVSGIKEKVIGSEPLSKDSFRESTFNAFTYYIGGGFILLFTMILWQIIKILYTSL